MKADTLDSSRNLSVRRVRTESKTQDITHKRIECTYTVTGVWVKAFETPLTLWRNETKKVLLFSESTSFRRHDRRPCRARSAYRPYHRVYTYNNRGIVNGAAVPYRFCRVLRVVARNIASELHARFIDTFDPFGAHESLIVKIIPSKT